MLATVIVFISYGTRQSFGLFLRPITMDMGWGRESLSFAFATQSLMIGISAPSPVSPPRSSTGRSTTTRWRASPRGGRRPPLRQYLHGTTVKIG
ncbi:MAG: hypothetical protein IIA72_22950 [Proteobacteria bacterium]|nr:hypothetical protein [Pseudomonadota bacterium]